MFTFWGFPGGPAVKTPSFRFRKFNLWLGSISGRDVLHAMGCGQKKNGAPHPHPPVPPSPPV